MFRFRIKPFLWFAFSTAFLSGLAISAMFSGFTEKIGSLKFGAEMDEKMSKVLSVKTEEDSEPKPEGSILKALKIEFQRRNPKIDNVFVVDMRPSEYSSSKHLVLGWASGKDSTFRGDFEDELFGLFIIDASLNQIEKTLAFIPTPRWLDTDMRIEKMNARDAVIVGRSKDLGHVEFRRRYQY